MGTQPLLSPNPISELSTAAQRPGGDSPLTMRYDLRQSNHTIGPLDRSLASARRMEFAKEEVG